MLLCLGSFIGKIQTLDQLKRKGFSLANRCFLCHKDKEMTNHLFLYCVATGCFGIHYFLFLASLGLLLFQCGTPFWVVGICCQKSLEIGVESGSMHLLVVWKAKSDIVFRDDILSIQKLELFYVNLIWSENKLFI